MAVMMMTVMNITGVEAVTIFLKFHACNITHVTNIFQYFTAASIRSYVWD